LTALREIKLMSQLDNPNVLGLKEVVHSQGGLVVYAHGVVMG
jgi:hypothetical protein